MKRLRTLFCGTALGLGTAVAVAPTHAQDLKPPVPTVDERLERLEKLNETLLKQNQELKQELSAIKTQESPVSTVDRAAVQDIVSQYLQQQGDKGKAEKKDAGPQWYQVGSDPKMNGSWGLGRLTFESANKDFKAHVGGRFQFDTYAIGGRNAFLNSFSATGVDNPLDDGSFFRRIRVEMDGTAFEQIEWNMEVDLERTTLFEKNFGGTVISNGNYPPTRFDELWVGIKQLPVVGNVRIGHVRPPQGLECYTSSRNLTFLERSSGFEAFLQEFDPGIWIFNNALEERVSWAATLHGYDPSVQRAGWFGDGNWAMTGRLAGLPVYRDDGRCLVHVGASYQYHSNPQVPEFFGARAYQFAAPPDWRSTYFTPAFVNTGPFIADNVQTFGLEGLVIWGPLSVQAEYFGVTANDATFPATKKDGPVGVSIGSPYFTSAYVYATYSLTGENRRYDKRLGRIDRLVPNENFFFVKGEDGALHHGKGAWEVAARWDWIDLSDNGIQGGYMNNYTAGLNWYLNPNMKFQWNYTVTDVQTEVTPVGGGAGGKNRSGLTHAVGMRVQWEF